MLQALNPPLVSEVGHPGKREDGTKIYALRLSATLYRDIYFQFNITNLSFVLTFSSSWSQLYSDNQ